LELLLVQVSDERLRTNVSYYLDRIEKGIVPEKAIPACYDAWAHDHTAEQAHWSDRRRATAGGNADAVGRPRRAVLLFGKIT
jgi:hypothetical protein